MTSNGYCLAAAYCCTCPAIITVLFNDEGYVIFVITYRCNRAFIHADPASNACLL